jgi:hypothetical protein
MAIFVAALISIILVLLGLYNPLEAIVIWIVLIFALELISDPISFE